jgi:hypothetical protein
MRSRAPNGDFQGQILTSFIVRHVIRLSQSLLQGGMVFKSKSIHHRIHRTSSDQIEAPWDQQGKTEMLRAKYGPFFSSGWC